MENRSWKPCRRIAAAIFCFSMVTQALPSLAQVDNASLVTVTMPPGTPVMPRTIFTQTWTLQNTGSTTWTPGQTGYTLNLVGKDNLGAMPVFTNAYSSWYTPSAIINGGKSVPPGGQATFTMRFIAPEAPGIYTDFFQLNGTTNFGPEFFVEVNVPKAGSTNQYDRSRAISYANNYAGYICSDGYFWTNSSNFGTFAPGGPVPTAYLGDDCAHFVSCCIGKQAAVRGGGLPIPSRTATYGEPGATRLAQTVLIDPGYAVEVTSLSQMEPGDVIGWNWEGNTNMSALDHITLYTGNGMLASHAISAWDMSANTFFQSGEPHYVRHLIHILDNPTIAMTNIGNKVVVSWGTNWVGYSLYSSTSPQPGATWTKVATTPAKVGTSLMVTNTVSGNGLFYRLMLQ